MARDTTHQIDEFFKKYPLRRYRKGQILIFSGSDTQQVYHLVKGRVKQYDVSYRGDEIVVNTFKSPAFFPMSLAINQSPNPYIYEAETNVELHEAPSVDVVAMLKSNPKIVFDLLSRVYRGLDGVLERMAHLMKSSARERLMYEILIDSKRFGKKLASGALVSHINEGELAARSGLSRETVSREMGKLVKNGSLTYRTGRVKIIDPKMFENKLNELI
jgi:CRP-like cAMP-binding protein